MSIEQLAQGLIVIASLAWMGDIVRGIFQRKKVKTEANLNEANSVQVLVGTATELLKPLSARVKEAEDEASKLRQELKAARTEVSKLVTQLQECTAENRRVTQENKRLRARLA